MRLDAGKHDVLYSNSHRRPYCIWPLFDPGMCHPSSRNPALSHITPPNALPMMPVALVAGPAVALGVALVARRPAG